MKHTRQIILDTETTGLHPNNGDRLVEIGCIELINRRMTGNNLHFYINPQRDMPEAAAAIHGLREDFLKDQPVFADVAEAIAAFSKGAEVVIHNAAFDLGFLDMEFKRLGQSPFSSQVGGVIDTLTDAQRMFPGKRNRLDDLCNRFGVKNDHRTLHGALLDAKLLAEVYLCMTRGQNDLMMEQGPEKTTLTGVHFELPKSSDLIIFSASPEEEEEHQQLMEDIAKKAKSPPSWLH
ncbi:MAG: DNA polymerase III subunit epsilon [Betaproteobacteria bacterium]